MVLDLKYLLYYVKYRSTTVQGSTLFKSTNPCFFYSSTEKESIDLWKFIQGEVCLMKTSIKISNLLNKKTFNVNIQPLSHSQTQVPSSFK